MAKVHKFIKDNFLIIISGIVMFVSITCAILVWKDVANRDRTHGEIKSKASQNELCVSCSLLSSEPHSPIRQKFKKVITENKEMCCANNTEQASAIFEMLMFSGSETESLKSFDAGNFSLSKASAHKQLKVNTYSSYGEPEFLENENRNLQFDISNDPLIEHVRNVEIMKNAMVVRQPGRYFIYSSIFFKPDSSKPCKDLKRQIWEHNIILTRNNKKDQSGIIFNTTYTCCDSCITVKETSYAGGHFELEEIDRVHVEVSSDGVVRFSKEGSFLGLFMLN